MEFLCHHKLGDISFVRQRCPTGRYMAIFDWFEARVIDKAVADNLPVCFDKDFSRSFSRPARARGRSSYSSEDCKFIRRMSVNDDQRRRG